MSKHSEPDKVARAPAARCKGDESFLPPAAHHSKFASPNNSETRMAGGPQRVNGVRTANRPQGLYTRQKEGHQGQAPQPIELEL